MKLLIELSYLGTAYHGFQVQKNGITIQERLQDAIEQLYGERYPVKGCSRTDSGVHAKQYFCTVDSGDDCTRIPCKAIPCAVNRYLPSDISVKSAILTDDSFHVRHDVLFKEYVYTIYTGASPDPFSFDRTWSLYLPSPDISAAEEAASHIVGKHDFAAFMSSGSDIADTVRAVKECVIERDRDFIRIRISADGFLYNMVRIIAGTIAEVMQGKRSPSSVREAIDSCDRTKAGRTAPASGLCLNRVVFSDAGIKKLIHQ